MAQWQMVSGDGLPVTGGDFDDNNPLWPWDEGFEAVHQAARDRATAVDPNYTVNWVGGSPNPDPLPEAQ